MDIMELIYSPINTNAVDIILKGNIIPQFLYRSTNNIAVPVYSGVDLKIEKINDRINVFPLVELAIGKSLYTSPCSTGVEMKRPEDGVYHYINPDITTVCPQLVSMLFEENGWTKFFYRFI